MRSILVAGLACAIAAALPAQAANKTVKVNDDAFAPRTLTVAKGTKVTWKWTGIHAHNVVVKSGPKKFRSPIGGGSGFQFSHKMTAKGTYKIVCELHATTAGMKMTLKVT